MNMLFILENKMFNELVNCEYNELQKLFSYGKCFFSEEKFDEIRSKIAVINKLYEDEMNKIEDYEKGEYLKNIETYGEVCFDEEPSYMIGVLETKIKHKVINIIETYFDEDVFKLNKSKIVEFKDETIVKETNLGQLDTILSRIRKRLYSFLSIIGYYQRKKNYFLTKSAVYNICSKYSKEVYIMNKGLGKKELYHNIFGEWGRISPEYIDVDKVSLHNLILPYLRTNINELIEIIKIMLEGFKKYYGNEAWDYIKNEVEKYIKSCEEKGVMKEVY